MSPTSLPTAAPAGARPTAATLARREDPALRALAARDAFCPPDVLATLARDSCAWVRHAAASHPSLPRATMTVIADGAADDAALCEQLAHNPSAPERVLRTLARHRDPQVRVAVARNPFIDTVTLARLADDAAAAVRVAAQSAVERAHREATRG